MVYPCIEVTLAKIGKHTVEDESTEDGQRYRQAFHDGATGIPGCLRGCWGRSDKYPEWVIHFLDYDSRKEHDVHKALINGPAPPVLHGLQSETHVFVIHPNTNERTRVYYAPYTVIHFFWGIKEDEWTKLAPEFMAAVAKSDACTGYIWGEVDNPVLSDPTGYSKLGSGKGGILASGWRSKDQYDRDCAKPRFVDAYKAMGDACEEKDSWGMSLTVTENTGHIHRWRTPLAVKDRTSWLPAAGII